MYMSKYPKIEGYTAQQIMVLSDKVSAGKKMTDPLIQKHIIEQGTYHKWNSLSDQVAYWRKANQIHNWFVEHVQGGEDEGNEFEVSKEQLEQLLFMTNSALNLPELAGNFLPTKDGFFFGSTNYDEYYFDDLKLTKEVMERVLQETNFDTHFLTYHASW